MKKSKPQPRPSRSELILETVAEIAANPIFDNRAMVENTARRGIPNEHSLSDVVRQRLIDAAGNLADIELERPRLWERDDWRTTCDFIGARLNDGFAVSRDDILAVLE